MTENEAKAKLERTSVLWESATNTEMVEAVKMAIKALEEIQQYRAIGTIEEFKDLKEADMKGANRAVDEFANYLHRIAKENNGLRLSSETRSWTHACIFDYVNEFKEAQIKGGE